MNKPITLCDRCEKAARCLLNFDGIPCRKNRTVEPTNYDRLISKTPEELAEKMVDYSYCPPGTACKPTCKECWLSWLKSPIEVDNG